MADQSDEYRGARHQEPVSLIVSGDEARAIDAWSAAHHIEDRAEAIHRLVHLALDAHSDHEDEHLR